MYKSDFTRPARILARIDCIADALGVPNIAARLADARASVDGIYIASTGASSIEHTIVDIARAAAAPLDTLNAGNFAYIEADTNPINNMNDTDKFAFRFGAGYIAITRDTYAFDMSHNLADDDTTALDLIVASCAIKFSQRDRFCLVRYNDKAMIANPVFASGNYTESSSARFGGDIWSMFDGALLEMRSVVLDIIDNKIVALPFYKFRNLGECETYSVERVSDAIEKASHVEITDKMDGSFVQMKYVEGAGGLFGPSRRLTSMSGSLNPETNETLAFIYDWVDELESAGARYTDMCRDYADWTFIFEFIRPDIDSHIVQYDKSRWNIYLLSARNIETGETMFFEEISSIANTYNLPHTVCFDSYDLDKVLEVCHTADVSEREGFVVNIDGWYVKVKLDEFCAISKLVHGSDNFNVVIANVAKGQLDDLLAKIPMTYHDKIIASAREMLAFNEQMDEYVSHMANITPAGDMRTSIAFIQERVPRPFVSLVIDKFKTGLKPNYLYKNPRHDTPSCWKAREFAERAALLAEARKKEGL